MNSMISESMLRFFLVLTGGGLGSASRYGVSLLAARLFGTRFPYGTMIVNLTGCLLIGICFELAERAAWFGTSARLFFMTGFLGGLTTFSTFALETVISERKGTEPVALINFFANNVIGMGMILIGMWLVQYVFEKRY
ncbi:Putative fluoride ion transporter [Desulfonema limicola]|uniref:Fluoride-specific ion channel FluC n=2 Tax=Desulfonema limicola TaxID=45656 RepID=A0A975BBC2_9BACT|nr:Putative fluoride ion transporter [Desulfonema limicola]